MAEVEKSPFEKKDSKPEKKEAVKKVETQEETQEQTFVMKVTHLSWGLRKMNHFYADKKPLISRKVMRNYQNELDEWIKNEWVIPGKY